jgi:hypothetical protein
MLRSARLAILVGSTLLAAAFPLRSEAEGWRFGASAGAGSAFGQAYGLVGGLVGYELALGLELDVHATWWFGNTPSFLKLGPGLTWYVPLPVVRPYIGGFYSHWFVGSNFPDQDSLGARGGLLLVAAGPAALGVGVVYERLLDCTGECDSWAPEVTATVRF